MHHSVLLWLLTHDINYEIVEKDGEFGYFLFNKFNLQVAQFNLQVAQ